MFSSAPISTFLSLQVLFTLNLEFGFSFIPRPQPHRSSVIPTNQISNYHTWLSASSTELVDTQSLSTETLTLFSPCKINLFLRIIRKRPDGFHDLASLFQAIGFGDTLELSITRDEDDNRNDKFNCNMPGVPLDSSNLVLRALQLMRNKTGRSDVYFNANLIKQVPAQAGLGGGSANAATAMWGANELMGRPASLKQVQ